MCWCDRDVDQLNDEMKAEVMQLLDLFGVPYVVSPMEAEAQCAVLEVCMYLFFRIGTCIGNFGSHNEQALLLYYRYMHIRYTI